MSKELTRFSAYYLGHEKLDQQHKAIYDALDALWRTVPPDSRPDLLEAARIVCAEHFAYEKQLMLAAHYPYAESHFETHVSILEIFLDVINHPTTEKLRQLVDDHLTHIDLYDRLFVEWMDEEPHRRRDDV